jgi:hypothetical protein
LSGDAKYARAKFVVTAISYFSTYLLKYEINTIGSPVSMIFGSLLIPWRWCGQAMQNI